MLRAEHEVVIDRPPQEVFDYLADGTNDTKWRTGVLEIERISSTAGEGAVYRQVLSGPGGRRIRGDYRITQFIPPRVLAFQVTAGPVRPTGLFELTRIDDATRVRFTLDLHPHGLMRLLAPVIAKQVRREVSALENLKRVLER